MLVVSALPNVMLSLPVPPVMESVLDTVIGVAEVAQVQRAAAAVQVDSWH